MSNSEQLKKCFEEALVLPASTAVETLAYQSHPSWDSVGHMRLIAAIETAFNIMLSTDEILALSDFAKAHEIVKSHDLSSVA